MDRRRTYRAVDPPREGTPPVPLPTRVDPLMADLGTVEGHRIVLLSLEVYDVWADLRFARVAEDPTRPLPRRVPPADAWTVRVGDADLEVVDAVGRGDRDFSNGEVRLTPPPPEGVPLQVAVTVTPGSTPLTATLTPGGA